MSVSSAPDGDRLLALKVDVDTCEGTLAGVPALLALFAELGVQATFLFSLGPDHTGRALRRVLRRGFLGKVRRTSVARHYGIRTLLYGVLLPGPVIARKAGHVLRAARDAGHELGIHAWDHVRWQDHVSGRGREWTSRELHRALASFRSALAMDPVTAGAAGWQINSHVLTLEDELSFAFASDTRGRGPFLPVMAGTAAACVQLPTTLPTLDELLGRDGIGEADLSGRLLAITAEKPGPHVYTLHAELEGRKLMGVFRRLLEGWREQGYQLGTLGDVHRSLDPARLPRCAVEIAEVPGRSGTLACQGEDLTSAEIA